VVDSGIRWREMGPIEMKRANKVYTHFLERGGRSDRQRKKANVINIHLIRTSTCLLEYVAI
jgi:hypothetical protein